MSRLLSDIDSILADAQKNQEKTAQESKNSFGELENCATLSTASDLRKVAQELLTDAYRVSVEDVLELLRKVTP